MMGLIGEREIVFDLRGFESGSTFVAFVRSLVSRLHSAAPTDTVTTASFVRTGEVISGTVVLCTNFGVFSSRAQGRNGHLVARWIAKELSRQLKKLEAAQAEAGLATQPLVRKHLTLLPSLPLP